MIKQFLNQRHWKRHKKSPSKNRWTSCDLNLANPSIKTIFLLTFAFSVAAISRSLCEHSACVSLHCFKTITFQLNFHFGERDEVVGIQVWWARWDNCAYVAKKTRKKQNKNHVCFQWAMFDKCYSSSPLDTSGNYIGNIVTVLPSSLWMKAAEKCSIQSWGLNFQHHLMNVYLLLAYIWEPECRMAECTVKKGWERLPGSSLKIAAAVEATQRRSRLWKKAKLISGRVYVSSGGFFKGGFNYFFNHI